MLTPSAVIDAVSTFPYFIQLVLRRELPYTTPIRCLRLARILKAERVAEATSSVWRVVSFNKEILIVAGIVALILTLVTATLLYYLQPKKANQDFHSIPATMFMAVLMLTGQGGPDGDLPWYTKVRSVLDRTLPFPSKALSLPSTP